MKKIALLTWYDNGNYGTALQAFALKQVLEVFGVCEIIPYKSPKYKYSFSDIIDSRKRNKLFEKIADKIAWGVFKNIYTRSEIEKHKKMDRFFRSQLNISRGRSEVDELQEINSKYDLFVCGSDQIWNPRHFDSAFFLDFVEISKRKIAYAPSFGLENVLALQENKERVTNYLKNFDYLSIREKAGQEIIFELLGKEVPICADPTLLRSNTDWIEFAKKSTIDLPENYVYCLFLGDLKKHLCEVEEIANKINSRVIIHPYNRTDYFIKADLLKPLDPNDFVKAIMNSRFVCTDSYHATIFSIIFHKPFVAYRRFERNDENSQNSRLENMLERFGLINRLDVCSDKSADELLNEDFTLADFSINELVNESFEYLRKALR